MLLFLKINIKKVPYYLMWIFMFHFSLIIASREFKKENISYISIMPNFRNEDGYESPYFGLLEGDSSSLSGYLMAKMSMMAFYSYLCDAKTQEIHGIAPEDMEEVVGAVARLFAEGGTSVQLLDGKLQLVVSEAQPEDENDTVEEIPGAVMNGRRVWAVWKNPERRRVAPEGMRNYLIEDNLEHPDHQKEVRKAISIFEEKKEVFSRSHSWQKEKAFAQFLHFKL